MTLLFSLLGFELDISLVGIGLYFLAGLMGFIIGGGLRHSIKIVLILLGIAGVAGLFVPSVLSSLGGVLSLVNPLSYVKILLDLANTSLLLLSFCGGLVAGLWKG